MRSIRREIARAVTIGALMLTGPLHGADEARLVLHWEPGRLYKQQTETQTSATLTPAPGELVEQRLSVTQTTEIRVKADGTSKRAEVKFSGVTGEMKIRDKTFTFDSANPSAAHPLLRQAIGETTGKSFTAVFDAEDRFIGLKDMEKLASDGSTITGLAAVAGARAAGELFVRSLDMGLPKEAVAPGDEWDIDDPVHFPQAGRMKVKMHSKYEADITHEGRRHAKVTFEGTLSGDSGGAGGKGAPMTSLGPESKLFGHVFYDLERRTVSVSAFTANLVVHVQGNRIPMRQQVTTRLVSITDIP